VEADPDPDEPYACRKFGFELTFPASLVLGQPECLHREISFALAQTLRCATRQHWALVLSMLEEPMARWERRRRGQATEEECDRKWDALLKPYLRAYQQEVTQILRRWGFVDAAADPQAAPRGGKRAAEEA
jgi:hypothetical protein